MTERHVGFSGTRLGMSEPQAAKVKELILGYDWMHHGDCVGADHEAHALAQHLGLCTKSHPPVDGRLRAYCVANIVARPKPFLVRDRDIVAETEALVAAPASSNRAGGTWATIGYALDAGKPVTIVLPDGSAQHHAGKTIIASET